MIAEILNEILDAPDLGPGFLGFFRHDTGQRGDGSVETPGCGRPGILWGAIRGTGVIPPLTQNIPADTPDKGGKPDAQVKVNRIEAGPGNTGCHQRGCYRYQC